MALDQVDRPAKLNAQSKVHGAGHGLRICLAPLGPVQPKRQLEIPWHVAGVVFTCAPEPFAEVSADRSNTILPDTVDGRSKIVSIAGGDFRNDAIELLLCPVEIAWPYWKKAVLPEASEQVELNVVD
jgi:hypothetical protein